MLDMPEPAPTGLITALLGRARPAPSAITAAIGPSPRQMRELTEGRGLFSPYKIGRVAELTRIPEPAIRDALARLPELVRLLDLKEGGVAHHPRLGACEVIVAGPELTIRTGSGEVIDGIHPVSFAGADLLDRFGLTPTPPEGEMGQHPVPQAARPRVDPEAIQKAVRKPEQIAARVQTEKPNITVKTDPKETILMSAEPDPEPAIIADAPAAPILAVPPVTDPAETDPRDILRGLIARSGMSQAALSRALGKDPSFLNAILTRGRRMPEDIPGRILSLIPPPSDLPAPGPVASPEPTPDPGTDATPLCASPASEVTDPVGPLREDLTEVSRISEGVGPTLPEPKEGRTIVLECAPTEEETDDPQPDQAEAIEVIIEGVCRLRVPRGFDMEAAARLIRSVSAPFRSAPLPA